jgi:hypothetical protein
MKRKEFKQLGDPTVQAGELATVIKNLSGAELLALAHQKHAEMEEAGELDGVGDEQTDAPPLDDSMVGSKLEVCWLYWRPPSANGRGDGEWREAQEDRSEDVVRGHGRAGRQRDQRQGDAPLQEPSQGRRAPCQVAG